MINFPGKRSDEEVLLVVRKHIIVYTRILVVFLVTVLLPLIGFLLGWFSFYPFYENHTSGVIVGLFSCVYLLYGLLFTCIAWLNEEFDLFIITNQRLIDITQISFLKRTVTTTPLEQIQDTTSNVDGILATMLNYGDLVIQTAAGDASDFQIDHVSHPAFVARKILNWAHDKQNGKFIN
jgi:hypothetical protein